MIDSATVISINNMFQTAFEQLDTYSSSFAHVARLDLNHSFLFLTDHEGLSCVRSMFEVALFKEIIQTILSNFAHNIQ